MIGLLAVESRSPDTDIEQQGLLFIEEVLRGVEASLGAIEWSLLIALLRDDDPAGAYRRMQKISAKVDGVLIAEGIVSSDDQMAIGAIRELQLAGLRVPADMAVVGFDDMHAGALLNPPLTTVRQPMRLLGERACARLLQRIAQPALPRHVERLPAELSIRESCGCGPHSHLGRGPDPWGVVPFSCGTREDAVDVGGERPGGRRVADSAAGGW